MFTLSCNSARITHWTRCSKRENKYQKLKFNILSSKLLKALSTFIITKSYIESKILDYLKLKTRKFDDKWRDGNKNRRFRTGYKVRVQLIKEKNHLWNTQLFGSINYWSQRSFIWSGHLVIGCHNVCSSLWPTTLWDKWCEENIQENKVMSIHL